ncbi:MAG: NADH:ubiquinone reductase (Na(+)-transporting) subunit B [Acidobacteria bacterium]|nr:NADH:ubiquinone reductase (Na(+)-transporting) subunit B [Acidobacteriota bacterium]
MRFLRKILDDQEKKFTNGGPLERFYALFEAQDTFLFTPGETTRTTSHVRDAIDMKRLMSTVVVALLGCVYMAMYNTGYQANLAISRGAAALDNWQTTAFQSLGFAFDPSDLLACIVHGALYYLPVLIVTLAVGGAWEALFAIVRGHEINEGFLVTWMLFPLVLPPAIPLWQVALGISFGVVIGKEIFGGTGKNIFNPALMSRAFLFFAYPVFISGDRVWIAAQTTTDGVSGATWLARAAEGGQAVFEPGISWWDAFMGYMPGSMGETSALACLVGAAVLLITGIGSWRVMTGVVLGSVVMSMVLNAVGSTTNPFFDVPFYWHFVLGGWAFGAVFMATDPVSSAHTNTGRWIYGFLIGVFAIIIRVVNPAYPEGMMLAILLMNVFAATIDYYVVRANIKRRSARYAT